MKRLLFLLLLTSSLAHGQRYFYSRATIGGSSSYQQISATDVPDLSSYYIPVGSLGSNGNATTFNGTGWDIGGIQSANITILGNSKSLTWGTSGSKLTTIDFNSSSTQTYTSGSSILLIGTSIGLNASGGGQIGINGDATNPGKLRIFTSQNDGLKSTLFTVGPQLNDITYTLPLTSTDGVLRNVSNALSWGSVSVANGGTGLTSLGSALQQLRVNSGATALEYFTPLSNPLTTDYDIPYWLSGAYARLAKGSNGQFLTTQSGALSWANSILLPDVTTGTGTTAGFNLQANNLTTGNGVDFSSSSVSSGNVLNVTASGTAAASSTKVAIRGTASGANATGSQRTFGVLGNNTSTGSGTNIGLAGFASGGSTNVGLLIGSGQLLQESTQGFASSITAQSVQNNSNEVFNLTTSGVPTWNLYNTSGTKTGDFIVSLGGGTNPNLAIRNGGATTRYNLNHDPANDVFAIYENTIANTKVAIGGTATPSATLEVIGRGTTTGVAFKVGNSAQATRLSIADDGTTGFQGPLVNFGNGTSAASVRILEPSGSGTNYSAFTVAAQSGDITYTLPTALPSVTSALTTTSGGTMSTIALSEGTYTPTLTNVTNISASTAYVTGYYRVGSNVTVYGKIDLTPTAAASTATEIAISLPVTSNLAAEQDLGGAAESDIISGGSARIKADATNDRASVVFKAGTTSASSYSFTFSYQVK